jgi:hypothetical protein
VTAATNQARWIRAARSRGTTSLGWVVWVTP